MDGQFYRTMPLAVLIGMTIVTLIYLLVNCSYFIVLDGSTFLESNAIARVSVDVPLSSGSSKVILGFRNDHDGKVFILGPTVRLHSHNWGD